MTVFVGKKEHQARQCNRPAQSPQFLVYICAKVPYNCLFPLSNHHRLDIQSPSYVVTMPKTYIHLVRHAQGYHNLSVENYQIPDPDLTPLGEEQCAKLRKNFPYHDNITYLVASPMRRTLRTCLLSFAPAIEKGKKVIALPELQEVSTAPCDIGTDAKVLAEQFKDEPVDFSLVKLVVSTYRPC